MLSLKMILGALQFKSWIFPCSMIIDTMTTTRMTMDALTVKTMTLDTLTVIMTIKKDDD